MKHKALVVNHWSGPGAGKSTSATGAFSRLKALGVNAEYVSEVAKDYCWAGRPVDNQVLILGEQYERVYRAASKTDVILTDSPILLSAIYNKRNPIYVPSLGQVALELRNQFDNLDIFIKRAKPYNPVGRFQNEEQARIIDDETREMLGHYGIAYQEVPGSEDGIEQIVKAVLLALTLR
jgi:hypothetical protein